MANALLETPYKKQALVPASPWLDNQPPAAPQKQLQVKDGKAYIQWTHPEPTDVFHWVLYYEYGSGKVKEYTIFSRKIMQAELPVEKMVDKNTLPLTSVRLTAVDRCGNESPEQTMVELIR